MSASGRDTNDKLQRLVDRAEIHDCMARYVRGVDRGDAELMRSAYFPDAYDDHVDYKCDVEGFIKWLDGRFAPFVNSMHHIGGAYIEFS